MGIASSTHPTVLQASMTAEAVPIPTQNRLLARLAPMRGQIIDK
ncbi:hypothetical protein [Stutzerimonas stutzeri]|nr:hypothetical protein [Stutzerimonas stutzeri]